jgi:hypothetical protein
MDPGHRRIDHLAVGPDGRWRHAAVGAGGQGGRVRLSGRAGWLGRRSWAGALAHATAGLITGIILGSARLALAAQSTSAPPRPAQLVVQGVNELLTPVGCALVVDAATILAKRIATGQQPMSISFATTGNQLQAS